MKNKKAPKKASPKTSVTKKGSATTSKKSSPKSAPKKENDKNKKVVKSVQAEIVDEDTSPTTPAEEIAYDKTHYDEDFALEAQDNEAPEAALVPSSSKAVATADPAQLYLAEIRKYPVLSREDEQKLAIRYFETKDPEAAQALVKANLRFVVKVAAEYSKFGAKLIDLVQEGNIGLMHAVKEFNPYKGVRLITYAVWWIRGYIQEYLMKQYSLVRIGTTHNQRKLFYQLQKEKDALDSMGIEPDIKLISSRLGIPEEEVEMMSQRMSGRDVSLNQTLDEDSKTSLQDLQKSEYQQAPDEQLAHAEMLDLLKEKIDEIRPQLTEKEKIILDERLLSDHPLTLQEIGEKYGTTREAVRQMEVRVMNKIKNLVIGET